MATAMWEALSTVRDLGRLQEIASVLIRYGFGDVVRRIGMADVLERAGRLLHWHNAEEMLRMSAPQRVRRALQDLGPTFVKLGQVLATRVDLLPPEWIDEPGELQNAAPALPYAQILPQLIEAWRASHEPEQWARPYGYGTMFDLAEDPNEPMRFVRNGIRTGRHALIELFYHQQEQGVSHVALNLKPLRRPAQDALAELAEYVLPLFHAD